MIRQNAGRLSLLRAGSGEPLVLLHPLALAGQLWWPFADRFADFDVLGVDLRGHGESEWDGNPFSIADMADDLAESLDVLGLTGVHLLGMSMGGSVAMTLAGKYPDRVRSLILADTTAWYGADAPSVWAGRADRAANAARADQLPFQLDRWFSDEFRKSAAAEIERVCDLFLRTNSQVHAAASVAMGDLDARPVLPSIGAATLVLVGEHDYATPPSMAEDLANTIPGAKLKVLPDLRHMSLIERPELAETIRHHITESQ